MPGEKFAVGSGATLRIYDLLGNPLETFTFTGNLTGLSYHQGRFIVTGPTSYDGVEIPGLARLSLDGTLDDNFPGGSGPNGSVTQIRFDPTGRMIAVGSFTNWNGIPRERIARLLIEAPEAGFFLPSSLAFEDESPHQIQLVRYGDDSEELTVNVVSSDDTATSPADYTAIDQSFTWPAGDSTPITLDLSLINNADTDGDRSLTLTMTSGPGSDAIVTNTHTVTIRDDESLPSIDSQPEDVFGLDGSPASFAVSVSSPSPLIYQWHFNGALIPGANSNTYAIASIAPGNEGLYSVLVTNDYDSIFSDSVSLTIVEPPLNVADGYTPTLTFSSTIRAVATAPDGGAYVGGDFINLNSDLTRDYFAKVNADGTLDTSFSPVIDNRVMDIVVQEDGKIIGGGNFNNVEGSQSRDLARFNPDGTADTAFNANIGSGSNNRVEGIDILPDGKIIVAGVFSSWAGSSLSPQRDLIRLDQDGTLDIAYDQRTSSPSIYDVKALPTGEVLVAFNTSSFAATKVARFTPDGLLDSSFDYSSGKPMVRRIALASDGDYLFTGAETFKINPDGSTDTSFGAITGNDLRQQINSKIVTTQRNIVRYLPGGAIDPIFPSSRLQLSTRTPNVSISAMTARSGLWEGSPITPEPTPRLRPQESS
ncbi:hypothetical protein N9A94_05825 [Akkermansiaceae bacterium]|nr:hypothetical protein [Akkermansiaceae bacterium]MDB4544459.1 hypothetical protein [Akkermansiaceae bacterium]